MPNGWIGVFSARPHPGDSKGVSNHPARTTSSALRAGQHSSAQRVHYALDRPSPHGWVYPSGLVDRAVAACSRTEQRRRLLLARLVMYFVLGLALFSPAPYLDVMRHLVEGLRGQGLLGDWHIPAKSSLFRARQRLGPEPLRVLFTTTAKPMGTEATPGAFWRGLRLLAVDGTCWDVADSPANEAAFGRPRQRPRPRQEFPSPSADGLPDRGGHAPRAGRRAGRLPHRGSHPGGPPAPLLRRRSTGPGRPQDVCQVPGRARHASWSAGCTSSPRTRCVVLPGRVGSSAQ
ncbi:transposase domain-containing protein [Streptomyces canus]|uniref:transposase domain-containing protein n=1 Tax=Streptomyces canus TaxID=58343 RepID=UPI0036E2C7FA